MEPEEKKQQKVLLVDDDRFLLNMYSMKFKNSGYEVFTAVGAEEAMNILVEQKIVPDIILLDIIMPTTDGLTLLEDIRKQNLAENATVIMLTNQSGESDIERAKTLGVRGYIVKATTIPSEVVEEVIKITNKQ